MWLLDFCVAVALLVYEVVLIGFGIGRESHVAAVVFIHIICWCSGFLAGCVFDVSGMPDCEETPHLVSLPFCFIPSSFLRCVAAWYHPSSDPPSLG